jgi:ubiquinone/menaquinone biosynthesis C-methylase UbiE
MARARLAAIRPIVALIAAVILPPLAWVVTRLGSLVGYLYLRSWPTRNLPFFDHRYDHLEGPSNWNWQERGVFGAKTIPSGGKVLDLCCGDGTYSGIYYAARAGHVDALDRNPGALRLARRRYPRRNVAWIDADVLATPFPASDYDVVMLFAAIEHFSVRNGTILLAKIAKSLKASGTLIGSTPIFTEEGGHNVEHDNEFFSIDYLVGFLEPHFGHIETWTSDWRGRLDAYFECTVPKVVGEVGLTALISELEQRRVAEQASLGKPAGVLSAAR